MKRLFLTLMLVIALFAMPVTAIAAFNVTFAWDANTTDTDLAGYKVYQSNVSNSYPNAAVGTVPVGTETITLQVEDGTWYWIFTAFDVSGNENDKTLSYFNEVTTSLDSEAPAPPTGTRIIVIIKVELP